VSGTTITTSLKAAALLLQQGQTTSVRLYGGSMRGRIESGQLVALEPAAITDLRPDDVVFICWKGNYLLHLVLKVEAERVLIGNNVGKVNGWVSADAILGRLAEAPA
jgi:hypothetical protein